MKKNSAKANADHMDEMQVDSASLVQLISSKLNKESHIKLLLATLKVLKIILHDKKIRIRIQ